ncbi:hypothetical protein [Amnibacterium setariae]|uniref:Uncharacterized protein n=1 Tax=Amnibacterium setariae TaxID=2306585 RepID=A0A3A1U065_9MICO|nr:hypothetical protein [Amnibacterium setariae]RIX27846.1 hypothetical protein D1781_09945 [Amnibacterium setariae]
MANEVLPYRVPSSATVVWSDLELWTGAEWTSLPDRLEGWDPFSEVRVRGGVTIDGRSLEQETGIGAQELELALVWSCSTTAVRAASSVPLVGAGSTISEFVLDGTRLSGTLDLALALTLRQERVPHTVTAHRRGSVLARRAYKMSLQGTGGMFPVEITDFAMTSIPPEISWYLESSADLDLPFLASFRLLINSHDGELVAAVAAPAPDPRQDALLDALQEQLTIQLIEFAVLLRGELLARASWPAETAGDVLRTLLVRSRTESAPSVPLTADESSVWRSRLWAGARELGAGRAWTA